MTPRTCRRERPLRIAQVAPLYESVPSPLYGGTERVVSYLTETLVEQGHQVTLFASGDSVTRAELIAGSPHALRTDENCKDPIPHHLVMLEQVYRQADRFDLVHFHVDYLHFPMTRCHRLTHLTTLHGRLDLPDLPPLYRQFADMPLVSISDAQRTPLPWVNWQGTVYHGLPVNLFAFHEGGGNYLAFLGRTSPEKGLDQAIHIARRTGRKLKIAAKVDKADRDYFRQTIEPMIRESGDLVEFLGEIGGKDKEEFLGKADALLFPIDWPEPFGLVMIEALACGTPVIANRRGSVPEVMEDGVTGFVVQTLEEAVRAVGRIGELDRRAVRRAFEKRFCAERMTADYVAIYRRLIEEHRLLANGNGRKGRRSIDQGKAAKVAADN